MDYTPDAAVAVFLEYFAHLLWAREVRLVAVHFGARLVVRGRIGGQSLPGDLSDAVEREIV